MTKARNVGCLIVHQRQKHMNKRNGNSSEESGWNSRVHLYIFLKWAFKNELLYCPSFIYIVPGFITFSVVEGNLIMQH